MSSKITVFVITGDSDSVMASVKEMVADTSKTTSVVSFSELPSVKTAIKASAVIKVHKTPCNTVGLSPIYRKPAAAFLASCVAHDNTISFFKMQKFIEKETGSIPSNRQLSSFLRNNDYIRLRETYQGKSSFYWVKKGSVYAPRTSL